MILVEDVVPERRVVNCQNLENCKMKDLNVRKSVKILEKEKFDETDIQPKKHTTNHILGKLNIAISM